MKQCFNSSFRLYPLPFFGTFASLNCWNLTPYPYAMVGKQDNFKYEFNLLPQYIEILKKKLRIAVIYGGNKAESGAVLFQGHNSRPYKSYAKVAQDIATTLNELGFESVYVLPDDMRLPYALKKLDIHLAWLNTAGVQGYNPLAHTPSLLEMVGLPYIGHNPLNATILDNKDAFKRELQGLGLPTAPFVTWKTDHGLLGFNLDHFKKAFGDYRGPFIVKPVSGRASLHVHHVPTIDELRDTIEVVYNHNRFNVIVEKYMSGKEYAISVCGHVRHQNGEFIKQARPFTISQLERVLEEDEHVFTSMDKKAISKNRVRLLDPSVEADKDVHLRLSHIAQRVYWEFNLKSLIRLDVRADEHGKLHILEANPKPDLKKPMPGLNSLTAVGLQQQNMSYSDLIMTVFADRIDYLLAHRGDLHPHLIEIIRSGSQITVQVPSSIGDRQAQRSTAQEAADAILVNNIEREAEAIVNTIPPLVLEK